MISESVSSIRSSASRRRADRLIREAERLSVIAAYPATVPNIGRPTRPGYSRNRGATFRDPLSQPSPNMSSSRFWQANPKPTQRQTKVHQLPARIKVAPQANGQV
ncbi:unnamed protein product [Protopolystoma xenopodis]|uniref:Uncharacterized protein n=1 Tax=Protopolystoma xenopodis TaxID=117903 RepID=A0A448WKD2_9PLAT|nr:unnamed protein product [Protopolystoma xenopodis]